MAITYPLALPTATGLRHIRIIPRARVAETRSPFTNEPEIQVNQGQWFEAEVTLPPGLRANAEQWVAFLLKLNGKEGTFLLGDPAGSAPRGAAKDTPGSPLVNGAGQLGNDLVIDGAPVSVTGYLLTGDWIQLGSGATARLYKVLDDANTDGSGNLTLTVWPELTAGNQPANNDPVVVSATRGVFRLRHNAMPYDINEALFYGIEFAAASEP